MTATPDTRQVFTLDDLRRIMRTNVGVDAGVDLESDISDVAFDGLGYDSLALLEVAAQVQREYGVPIPDDAMLEAPTPGEAVVLINSRLAGA
ncbi:acyl carrier protein [Umezawaea endophytica]|uniref:Acyl carrier protein n=1 Tax=Umezawaea endophytica TaxID=1654476 RepID=A0A9X2VXP0_9PSEU|nr:acyl carrier protein [Umezawaea endophytica]MCS7484102.1 acyl carrier protein [Umezawaea endophytica]